MSGNCCHGRVKPKSPPDFPGIIRRSVPPQPRFPGTLPPTWNVPLYYRNRIFTGREDFLAGLRAALTSGQPTVISGLGGVGKTQLAAKYAYRHAVDAVDYQVVWWMHSEEPTTLAVDYAKLAWKLGLPQKDEIGRASC